MRAPFPTAFPDSTRPGPFRRRPLIALALAGSIHLVACDTPTATDPTEVPIGAAEMGATAAADLFISEYVEGSSNNKALELFNGTGADLDLEAGGYSIQMYFNGNGSAGLTIALEGVVPAGDVFVLAQSNATAAILAQADQTNGAGWFNGDDVVVLRRGTTVVDAFGQIGTDPGSGWGSGDTFGQNNTLRRLPSVCAGDTDPDDAFIPADEWTGFGQDVFDGLGSHAVTCGGGDAAPGVVSTVPSTGSAGVPVDVELGVGFTEPVALAPGAVSLRCTISGLRTLTPSGGPTTFGFAVEGELTPGETCVLAVSAGGVTDLDDQDPPDALPTDVRADFIVAGTNACGAPATPISTVQGSGPATPLDGLTVSVEGVVVGDYEGASPALRGFYLQEEDSDADGDPATSEGVFVFNGNDDVVVVGDRVRVTGVAQEFQDQTQLGSGVEVEVCEGGVSVEPVDLSLPLASVDALEAVEGMLVRFPQTLYVTEHFQLGRFGQVVLSGGARLFQPTAVAAPGAGAAAIAEANALNRIILDDELNDQNPEPIRFGREGLPLSAGNTLRGGDALTGAVGVMSYTWAGNGASGNAFRLRPVNALGGGVPDFAPANPRPTAPPAVGGDLRVASFNVLNYYDTFTGCTDGVGGAPSDCRGADDAFELERQADKIVSAVTALDADVVGLIEIENDGYGPGSAIADLVGRLNAVEGPGTWALIDADARIGQINAAGTDAIKVGFIYKPARVTPVGATATLNTPDFVNAGDGEIRNRPAVAQAFESDEGARFVAVVNHFKSKGSPCDEPDAADGQGNCNTVRTIAARALSDWLATDPTGTVDPDVLILGDLNAYAMEDPVRALRDAGFIDLVGEFGGSEAYSYVFDGQWGYLDYAMATASLRGQVDGTAPWPINADEPGVLDYNTNFKSPTQVGSLYDASGFRSSDHDPVLVGLALLDPWGFGGFERPVDGFPALNRVRAGRAIPLTFSVGGDRGLDLFQEGFPRSYRIGCDALGPDGSEGVATATAGGSMLEYDPADGTYTYVWKTDPEWSGQCRLLELRFRDGTAERLRFEFR